MAGIDKTNQSDSGNKGNNVTLFETRDFYTKIPDTIIELHRKGKLTGGEFSIYVMLIQFVKMLSYKNQASTITSTRLTNREIANHCSVTERFIEMTLKKFRELKIIESTTQREYIKGGWKTKSRKITFLISAYRNKR